MTSEAQPHEPATLDESGVLFGDRYRLVRRLGEGGAGIVYVARDERIDAEVAVKVVRGSARRDEVTLARFHREAKAAGRLGHPNIVRVTDFGTSADGSPYVVMERLDGETLEAKIAREGPLTVATALDVHIQLADALAAAHAAGVLHRDVKPANVFLSQLATGKVLVKLLDFGLAELYAEPGSPRLTERGLLVGSLAYLAPERIEGQPADERSDVYAIGASLHESLTGELPFSAPNSMMLRVRILGGAPPLVSDLRPDVGAPLSDVVASCLARDPARRPATAADVRRALLVAHDAIVRAPITRPSPPRADVAPTPPPASPPAKAPMGRLVAIPVVLALAALAYVATRAPEAERAPTEAPTSAEEAELARVVPEPASSEAANDDAPALPAASSEVPPPTIAPIAPTSATTTSATTTSATTPSAPMIAPTLPESTRHRAPRAAAPAHDTPAPEPITPPEPNAPMPHEATATPEDGSRFDHVMEPDWGEPLPR